MNPVVIRYPLDLSGRHPDNKVVGERHGPFGPGNRAFVLNYGPFFAKSFVLKNATTGQPLRPRDDYKVVQTFIEPTLRTGLLVCSIVIIEQPAYGIEVEADYQVLGGDFSLSTTALENMLDSLANDNRPVHWGQIIGKPEAFPPTPHLHDINDTFGWQYVVAALESIRQAILVGDQDAEDDFYAYVDAKFGDAMAEIGVVADDLARHLADLDNPHVVTKEQLGLGNVGNYGLATPEVAALNISNQTLITPFLVPYAVQFHTGDFNNPHRVDKNQVNLGNVDNFITATLQMAIDGTDDASFLTPYKARAAFDAWGGGTTPNPTSPPVSRFTVAGDRNVPVGTNPVLTFTNTSTDGTSPIATYEWNFGNGQTSTVRNPPPVTYTFPETIRAFAVSLKVSDANGLNNSSTQSVTLTHVQNQQPPSGMVVTTNTSSVIYVDDGVAGANHTATFSVSVPTTGVGPFTYSWEATQLYDQRGSWIAGSAWTYAGRTPPNRTYYIPTNETFGTDYSQNITVTVLDQGTGLTGAVYGGYSCQTVRRVKPSLLVTGSAAASTNQLHARAVYQCSGGLGGETGWSGWTWANSGSSGTVVPPSFSGSGDPQYSANQVDLNGVNVGSGWVSTTLTATTIPNHLSVSSTKRLTFVQAPIEVRPPQSDFEWTIYFDNTVTRLSAMPFYLEGSAPVVSFYWSIVWDYGAVQTSSVRHPPTFTSKPGKWGASVAFTITDSNGLSSTQTRNGYPQ